MNAIEQLKSVLCNHDGRCCIAGSDEDRAIVDRALQTLAQRTWVGLTDEEVFLVLEKLQAIYNRPLTEDSRIIFAGAIEAKLKEKNFD